MLSRLADVPPPASQTKKTLTFTLRYDFKGQSRPPKLFKRGKSAEEVAEETRDRQVEMLQNVPWPGVKVEDVKANFPAYTLQEEEEDTAFAPAEITITAQSLEEALPLLLREELRLCELTAPEEITLSAAELSRLFVRIREELKKAVDKAVRRLEEQN